MTKERIIAHLLVIPFSILFVLSVIVLNIKGKLPILSRFDYFKTLTWIQKTNDIEKGFVIPMKNIIKEELDKRSKK